MSVFSPVAFNPGVPVNQYGAFSAYHRAGPNSLSGAAYDPSGTWLFDNVMVNAEMRNVVSHEDRVEPVSGADRPPLRKA